MNPTLYAQEPPLRVALIDDVQAVPEHEAWAAEMAQHRIEKLSLGFARQGHCVDIYRARSPGECSWEDLHAGVRIHRVADRVPWPANDQTQLSQAVMAFVNRVQCLTSKIYPCDVVHAWGPLAGLVALRLSRTLDHAPFVLNAHPAGPIPSRPLDSPDHSRTLAAIESLLIHRADHVLATSDAEQDHLLDEHGSTAVEAFHTIALGVDTHTFRPTQKRHARQQLGLPEDAFIVLWGDLLQPDIQAVKAATSFMRSMQDAQIGHLVLIGAGMRARAQAVSHTANTSMFDLSNHAGECVDTLRTLYATADVMVMPSVQHIPNGLNPKEAMACGTPVIALGCQQGDELQHIIVDGVTGYVLYRDELSPLLDLLRDLKAQPHMRSAMSTAALLRARTFFTWDRTAQQLLGIYHQHPPADRCVPERRRALTLVSSQPSLGRLSPVNA